jgi:hypothetical protein
VEELFDPDQHNASGDSADGSIARGNMSADLSRRKSGMDAPRRSVLDTTHQKIVVATLVADKVRLQIII